MARKETPATEGGPRATVMVGLPAALTSPDPARDIPCEAATVGEALRAAVSQAPRYAARIFYGRRLLVAVTLNGRLLPPDAALDTPLSDGDRVEVMLPVAGG